MQRVQRNEDPTYQGLERVILSQYTSWVRFFDRVTQQPGCDARINAPISKEEAVIDGKRHQGYTIHDNKGNVALKLSSVSTESANVGGLLVLPDDRQLLIETKTLKVVMKQNEHVKLSEYALGVEGALSETLYTPEGKTKFERKDAIVSVSGAIKPITIRDYVNVDKKITRDIGNLMIASLGTVTNFKDRDNELQALRGKPPKKLPVLFSEFSR
jgi:hypothetical protein